MPLTIPVVTICAARKALELHAELCRLEEETNSHDHDVAEFETCDDCERLPAVRAKYREHAALWADSFAKHIVRVFDAAS